MNPRSHLITFGLALFVLAALVLAIAVIAQSQAVPSQRILFIGNSFTDYNGGVDKYLKGLAPSIQTQRIAPGGYLLQTHWNEGDARAAIQTGGWDWVVLQEQSQTPALNAPLFYEFARKFDGEIKAAGAKPIFFMTWERPDSVANGAANGATTANLANAYTAIGAELGDKVAPVGLAFERALQQRPDLILNNPDGHPTVAGSYLAACIFYGIIVEQSPVDNGYAPFGMSRADRDFLQRIAAETLGLP